VRVFVCACLVLFNNFILPYCLGGRKEEKFFFFAFLPFYFYFAINMPVGQVFWELGGELPVRGYWAQLKR
jgi:hypothetical protein